MSWYEHGEVTVDETPGFYRKFVREYRNAEAPGAEVRISVYPVNTPFEDPDWLPGSITVETRWEYVLRPADGDPWSKEESGYSSLYSYPDDATAEGAARRIIERYRPDMINWCELSRDLPDPAWGRHG